MFTEQTVLQLPGLTEGNEVEVVNEERSVKSSRFEANLRHSLQEQITANQISKTRVTQCYVAKQLKQKQIYKGALVAPQL